MSKLSKPQQNSAVTKKRTHSSNSPQNAPKAGQSAHTPKKNTVSSKHKVKTFSKQHQSRPKKNAIPTQKADGLHPNNPHSGRYDMQILSKLTPALKDHFTTTPKGELSINFHDPKAVLTLNQALLHTYYGVKFWQIPEGYLCPPIPGRADYIHHLADLFNQSCDKKQQPLLDHDSKPKAKLALDSASEKVKVLDIGTGANCIYPILGTQSYGWQFVASDVNPQALKSARFIIQSNQNLKNKIQLRHQKNEQQILKGLIQKCEFFDLTMCNPPFHESMQAAQKGSQRKINNLKHSSKTRNPGIASSSKPDNTPVLNFAGVEKELCYDGGEIHFLRTMAQESKDFRHQVGWFTSLVSKKENVALTHQCLQKLGANQIRVIEMAQGQKISRFIAWSFFSRAKLQAFFNGEATEYESDD